VREMRVRRKGARVSPIPDVANGVGSVRSSDIQVTLGGDALYHTVVSPFASKQVCKDLLAYSASSVEVPFEDVIAAKPVCSAHTQSTLILAIFSALYAGDVTKPGFRESSSSNELATGPVVVNEVRLLQRLRTDFSRSMAYAIGPICGHQKSTHYAESLTWQAGTRSSDLSDINSRVKPPIAGRMSAGHP
jgi:hypothetical protein